MPELPEVETLRRALDVELNGRRIESAVVRDGRLRAEIDAQAIEQRVVGERVRAVRRRAKYLLVDLESNATLLLHLGMTGRIAFCAPQSPWATHDRVAWRLDDGRELRLNDARRFGLVEALGPGDEATHRRLAGLGVEPLEQAFRAESLHTTARGLRCSVKSFLMDARRVVGIGNIYASEALFAARIHPRRRAGRLSLSEWKQLASSVRTTLRRAIRQGGTSFRDFAHLDGGKGLFRVHLAVYGRAGEPCPRCKRPVRRVLIAGRSTFYCSACQR